MKKNIPLILVSFLLGMIFDSYVFRLPKLQDCYKSYHEVMDVVDYYSIILSEPQIDCGNIIEDNINLKKENKNLLKENEEVFNYCIDYEEN